MTMCPGPQPELEDVPIYATPEGCSPPPGPTTLLLQPPAIVVIQKEEGEEEGAEQWEGLEEEVDHEIAAPGNVCCCLLWHDTITISCYFSAQTSHIPPFHSSTPPHDSWEPKPHSILSHSTPNSCTTHSHYWWSLPLPQSSPPT